MYWIPEISPISLNDINLPPLPSTPDTTHASLCNNCKPIQNDEDEKSGNVQAVEINLSFSEATNIHIPSEGDAKNLEIAMLKGIIKNLQQKREENLCTEEANDDDKSESNHSNGCDENAAALIRNEEEIKLLKTVINNQHQQQDRHASFVTLIDDMIKNTLNGKKAKSKAKKSRQKPRAQNRVSYESNISQSARSKIQVSRQLTEVIIPNSIKETLCNPYEYVIKTIGLNLMHSVDEKYENKLIPLDLHEITKDGALFLIIQQNEIGASYQYRIIDKLFTASNLSSRTLSISSRNKFGIQHEMQDIMDYVLQPKNVQKLLKFKWRNIDIFNKKENKKRLSASIAPEEMNEAIKHGLSRLSINSSSKFN